MLIGQPGGGKSYEAVAFHILPALVAGRKVVTNMPLDVEAFRAIDSSFPALIDFRHDDITIETEKFTWNLFHRKFDKHTVKQTNRPFSTITDYGDKWRHPKTGTGILYVIDECHLSLPRARPGTDRAVEEWFSLHRHELADVLLITQSYGKVCKAICDMVQVLYRVKKASAFGSSNRYIRKVQDGIGGEVVNTSIRPYEKKYFSLYKSHTKSSEAGQELAANDIVPIWRRWPVLGAGMCAVLLFGLLMFGGVSVNPIAQATSNINAPVDRQEGGKIALATAPASSDIQKAVSALPAASGVSGLLPGADAGLPVSQSTMQAAKHPFDGMRFHVAGFLESSKKFAYVFEADQNGQPVAVITQQQLQDSGYKIEKLSSCSAKIIYGDFSFFAVCDSPRINIIQ